MLSRMATLLCKPDHNKAGGSDAGLKTRAVAHVKDGHGAPYGSLGHTVWICEVGGSAPSQMRLDPPRHTPAGIHQPIDIRFCVRGRHSPVPLESIDILQQERQFQDVLP